MSLTRMHLYTTTKLLKRHSITATIRQFTTIPSKSEQNNNITNILISIFTRKQAVVTQDNPELKTLSQHINPKIVESVLNGFKDWRKAVNFFHWASTQHGFRHNIYTYNAMASILSRARQNAELRALSMDVVNSRCYMSPGSLGFFIRCLSSVGLVDEACSLFDQARVLGLCEPNSYSYNCLLEAASKTGCVEFVEMRLNEMRDRGLEVDKYSLMPLVQVYCNAGNFDRGLDVYNEMDRRGWVDGHVLAVLVLSFSKWGEVDKACDLVEKMEDRDIRLSEKTFYVLIHGFVKESRVDKALVLFDKMKKYGFAPDVSLYDVLIGGLCTNKDLEKAFDLYIEMKDFGIQTDVGIITKLLSCCPDLKELIRLFEALHGNERMDTESMTLLYNSVLSSLVNSGFVKRAYYLLQRMMGNDCEGGDDIDELLTNKEIVKPDVTSFTIVIDGFLNSGELDLALSLLLEMSRSARKQDLLPFNNVISSLCKSNRLEEANALLKEMETLGLDPNQFTLNSMFGCLCKRMDLVGALDLVKRMRVHGFKPWIKHTVLMVKELCKHGNVVEACKFLDNMVQEGFEPDIIAYSAAIDGLIKIEEIDEALKLLHDICARGHCPDVITYNILIKGFCKFQRIEEAKNLLTELLEKGLVPTVVTYNLLIDGLCKNGYVYEALLWLNKMDGNIEPNAITYASLITGLCNSGKLNDALLLWNKMHKKGCPPNKVTYMAFICGLCKCRGPDKALLFLHEMEQKEMDPDTYVYVAVLSSTFADSNRPLTFQILKDMIEKGKLPNPPDKNYLTVREIVLELLEDVETSSGVKSLLQEGSLPTSVLYSDANEVDSNPKIIEG